MSAAITSGQTRTVASRVYDRLRKRSLRATERRGSRDKMIGRESAWYFDTEYWSVKQHEAYTAGVRDALNAIEEDA